MELRPLLSGILFGLVLSLVWYVVVLPYLQ